MLCPMPIREQMDAFVRSIALKRDMVCAPSHGRLFPHTETMLDGLMSE